jgi:hypothetical protein
MCGGYFQIEALPPHPEFKSASGEAATITRRRCSLIHYGRDACVLALGTISKQSNARPELAAAFQRCS